MPCICGNKVDRPDKDKVECIACNQFMHLKCFNINSTDVDLLKDNFKCKQCLTDRRGSLCSTPVRVSSPLFDYEALNSAAGSLLQPAVISTCAAENLESPNWNSSSAVTMPISDVSTFDVLVAEKVVDGSANTQTTLQKNLSSRDVITLDMLYNEIIALRASNESLCSIVSALRDDNHMLSDRVINLQSVVHNLQTILPATFVNKTAKSKQQQKVSTISADQQLECLQNSSPLNALSNNKAKSLSYAAVSRGPKTGFFAANDPLSVKYALDVPTTAAKTGSANALPTKLRSPNADVSPAAVQANFVPGSIALPNAATASYSKPVSEALITLPSTNIRDVVAADAAASAVLDVGETAISVESAHNWVKVINKYKSKFPKPVLGTNISNELPVAIMKKWVHLASFEPNVTAEQILAYVEKHTNLSKSQLTCYKLVKKDAVLADLRRVSFKLGATPSLFKVISDPTLWPTDIKVRPFKFFPRKQTFPTQT